MVFALLAGWISLGSVTAFSAEETAAKRLNAPIPLGFDVAWVGRPHRVARLSFFPSLDGVNGHFAFEGGTWANGACGSDDAAQAEVVSATLRGGDFQLLETPRVPLVAGAVDGRHGLFEYSASWELDAPASAGHAGIPVAWIAGWDVSGEGSFADHGATLAGFSVAVQPVGSRLRVAVTQSVGAVPDRIQGLRKYLATASVKVVAGWLPVEVPSQAVTSYLLEERRETGSEDEAAPWPGLCQDVRTALQQAGLPLPQEVGFKLEHDGRLPGRYLRRLRLAAGPGQRDIVDNHGPIARRLERTITKRGLLLSAAASAALVELRCDQGKANGGGLVLPAFAR